MIRSLATKYRVFSIGISGSKERSNIVNSNSIANNELSCINRVWNQ